MATIDDALDMVDRNLIKRLALMTEAEREAWQQRQRERAAEVRELVKTITTERLETLTAALGKDQARAAMSMERADAAMMKLAQFAMVPQ